MTSIWNTRHSGAAYLAQPTCKSALSAAECCWSSARTPSSLVKWVATLPYAKGSSELLRHQGMHKCELTCQSTSFNRQGAMSFENLLPRERSIAARRGGYVDLTIVSAFRRPQSRRPRILQTCMDAPPLLLVVVFSAFALDDDLSHFRANKKRW